MVQRKKRQDKLIVALMECSTVKEAHEKAGIPHNTAYKWLADPDFQKRMREVRQQTFDKAIHRLSGLASQAVDVLKQTLAGENIQKNQFLAAKEILAAAKESQADVSERLERLERLEALLAKYEVR